MPNTLPKRVVTENQAAAVACFASAAAQTGNGLEETQSTSAIGKHCMVETLTTVFAAFSAGSAGGWLLRSALARGAHRLRNFNAAPEGAETEAIERIGHSLRGAELLPLPTEIGEGPLMPETPLFDSSKKVETPPPQVVRARNSGRTPLSAISAATKHDFDRKQDASADKSNGNATSHKFHGLFVSAAHKVPRPIFRGRGPRPYSPYSGPRRA